MKPAIVIAQTYANVRAALQWHGILEPPTLATLADRVLYAPSRELTDRLDWLTVTGQFERWDFVKNHGCTARSGWRERVARCSMQVIVHCDSIEVDFDRFNPNYGAGPAFLHMLECLRPGKTDPFRIARGLRRRGIEVPNVKEVAA